MDPIESAKNAMEMVLDAVPGERVLIVADHERQDIAEAFASGSARLGLWLRMMILPEPSAPRTDPDPGVTAQLAATEADIYMNFMRGMAEETPFRIKLVKLETRKKKRLAHCPGTTLDMLENGALALSRDEYATMQGQARVLMHAVHGAESLRIANPAGTDLRLEVTGREFFTDTKIDWKTMKWMNLPVGEVIVGPHEHKGEGVIVCDIAIGGIGPIDIPLELTIQNGKAIDVKCKDESVLERVENSIAMDKMASHVGEFAFGLNPKARNVEEFVETEKIGGTVHVALGHNEDYPGGKNTSGNHMDFLMSKPTVEVRFQDGTSRVIMRDGLLDLE
jgi:leucyl aminopeptidase (aminopeptidase T)